MDIHNGTDNTHLNNPQNPCFSECAVFAPNSTITARQQYNKSATHNSTQLRVLPSCRICTCVLELFHELGTVAAV